jgi:signal transduction histidine kinase
MDEIVWAINPQKDKLESFTYYLTASAEECLRDSSMRFRLDFPDDPPDLQLSTHLRHNLLLATKEAIHNALKHSRGTEIELGLKIDESHIRITISDNGTGLQPTGEGREGNGLGNMKARLRGIGGDCTILNGDPQGVKVLFTAPL